MRRYKSFFEFPEIRRRRWDVFDDHCPWSLSLAFHVMNYQRLRQPALLIDPYYRAASTAENYAHSSPSSSSYMSSSTRTPSTGGPTGSGTYWRIFFVLCLYDYSSSDADHLSFKQNEILEIVKKEETGWWAALRGDTIGWVPCAFLVPLTDSMADKLRNTPEDMRIAEYDTASEKLPKAAPLASISQFFDSPSSADSSQGHNGNWPYVETGSKVKPTRYWMRGQQLILIHRCHLCK